MRAIRALLIKHVLGVGRLSLILELLAVTIPGTAVAQHVTTGSISGQVIDGASSPLVDVTVTLISSQGTKITRTDAKGRFLIPHLTPGTYDVGPSEWIPVRRTERCDRLSRPTNRAPLHLGLWHLRGEHRSGRLFAGG